MWEMLQSISDNIHLHISSVMNQIVMWGCLTFGAFLCSMLTWSRTSFDDPSFPGYRIFAAGTIVIFWATNILIWQISKLDIMLVTDSVFTTIAFFIHRRIHCTWSLMLVFLYSVTMGLDLLQVMGLNSQTFSYLSNFVFALQLISVSGLLSKRHRPSLAF